MSQTQTFKYRLIPVDSFCGVLMMSANYMRDSRPESFTLANIPSEFVLQKDLTPPLPSPFQNNEEDENSQFVRNSNESYDHYFS